MSGIECILLVDDDPITNYINQLLLEKIGFGEDKVLVTTDGDEALDIIHDTQDKLQKNKSVLLFFLDINMPAMDGFEVLDAMIETGVSSPQILVYLLTSSKNARDMQKANGYSIKGIVEKPLKEENIKAIIDALSPT